jgi:hypothetical protein
MDASLKTSRRPYAVKGGLPQLRERIQIARGMKIEEKKPRAPHLAGIAKPAG